jgi:uncharacterized membrane protein (UPF0127 family)
MVSVLLAAADNCEKKPLAELLVVIQGGAGPVRVRVEIADREEERARGLMFRNSLAEDAGMLFVYPQEGMRTFWMKNTYLPLDLIFIGSNKRIVGIIENARPLSEDHLSINLPAQYVLEVNGGFARRHAVRIGSSVELPSVTAW